MLANKKFNIKILNFLVIIKVIGILFLIPITFFYGTFQTLNKYSETVYFFFTTVRFIFMFPIIMSRLRSIK